MHTGLSRWSQPGSNRRPPACKLVPGCPGPGEYGDVPSCCGSAQQLGVERAGPGGSPRSPGHAGQAWWSGVWRFGVSAPGGVALAGEFGGSRLLDQVDVVGDAAGPASADSDEDAVVE